MRKPNRYEAIVSKIFFDRHKRGRAEVAFDREDFAETATALSIPLPKNLGDIIYSFRYRCALPDDVLETAAAGKTWLIRSRGRGRYAFVQVRPVDIRPNEALAETKIPNATPGLIDMYALGDEQALLAKIRYNRLIDIFTGVTCYSLQSHLRTTVPDLGQIETDEVYVGVDRRGAHFVFPVQAKGQRESLGVLQIEQDLALCQAKFPDLNARPIGAQFLQGEVLVLFEFEDTSEGIRVVAEKHYRLVPPSELTADEITRYASRLE